jgi:hypothetical protein
VLPRFRPKDQEKTMRTKLKLKLIVVLSLSILMNVFLMWEVQRKTNEAKNLEKELAQLKAKLLPATPAQ